MSTSPKTSPRRRLRYAAAAVTALAAGVAVLAGCSGSTAGSDTAAAAAPAGAGPSMAVNQEAVSLLPKDIRESGTLRVAIPTNEPPTQFYREGTQEMTGVNPDIARLLASSLGLTLTIDVTSFDAIIPGLAAGRYDLTVSSMTPTKDRMTQLDFVDYAQMGSALAVAQGSTSTIDFDTLCGKRVGVLKGSYQVSVNVPELDTTCSAAGRPPLDLHQFQDTRQAISAVLSDRVDVVYADSPILGYAAKQDSQVRISGENDLAPVAVGIPHDTGMLDPVAKALQAIVHSPEYSQMLASYGLQSMAVTDARVNAAQG